MQDLMQNYTIECLAGNSTSEALLAKITIALIHLSVFHSYQHRCSINDVNTAICTYMRQLFSKKKELAYAGGI